MDNLRIAVLRGGPSDEYSVSMKTGTAVIDSLKRKGVSVRDITVSREGEWLEEGKVKSIDSALTGIDVVFIAMHGAYSEDGQVQKVLQRQHIPFTGSSSLSSALAFNKFLTKETLRNYDIVMPQHATINRGQLEEEDIETIVADIRASFGPEYIIKPTANGSSIGMTLVRDKNDLKDSILQAFTNSKSDSLLIEEFVRGREATSGILEDFRNERLYNFPAVEVIPPREFQFFTNDAKYSGKTEIVCPARFSYKERQKIAEVSTLVHEVLNLSQYSRSDFIVRDGQVYFLEVNTLPGLTNESLYPKAAESVGLAFDDLVEHLVLTAKP